MKYWLCYFLAVVIIISGILFASDRLVERESLPTLSVFINGRLTEMSAEEVTLRILLAEGHNCKSGEAKKALAVAARSCALYIYSFGCKHDGFDLCDDGNCCFNLGDPVTAEQDFLAECVLAAEETYGLALTYDRLPAMGLFSLCHGSGSMDCGEFPYITAVAEFELCDDHQSRFSTDFTALCQKAGCDAEEIINNSAIVYDDNEKCRFAIIGGRYFSADELSSALGIESCEFDLTFDSDAVTVVQYGVGNGFGLSLCGGERLANEGKSFEKIIEYYYPNLNLNKIYQC